MLAKINQFINQVRQLLPLTLHMARMSLKSESMGTMGGFLWWILDPLFYCAIYYFVFAVVLKTPMENFVAFLITGLVIFRWVTMSVTQASNSILQKRGLIGQIDIPKVIFPVQVTLIQFIKFVIAFAAIFIVLVIFGSVNFTTIFMLPVVLSVGLIFALGSGIFLSALVPLFPDLRNIISMFMRAIRYVSLIFFDISQVPENYQIFIEINPLALLIMATRDVILNGQMPDFIHLSYIIIFGIIFGGAGLIIHKRLNRFYPRYLI